MERIYKHRTEIEFGRESEVKICGQKHVPVPLIWEQFGITIVALCDIALRFYVCP